MIDKLQSLRSTQRVHSKSIEKRQRILDAAAKALAEQGYSEAKLSEIAEEAGTHAGSLYYYFPSREDLIKEVLVTAVERLSEFEDPLEAGIAYPSPLDGLIEFVRSLVEQLTSMQEDYYLRAYMRNYNQVPESIRTQLKDRRRIIRRALARLIREAQAAGQIPAQVDAGVASQFIVGAINWLGLWYKRAGPNSQEEITETFLNLTLRGLLDKP